EYGNRADYKQAQDLAWQLAALESLNLLNQWPYPPGDTFGGQLYLWVFWSIYQTMTGANVTSGTSPSFLTLSSAEAVSEMSKVLTSQRVSTAAMNTQVLQASFEAMQSSVSTRRR